MLVCSAEQVSLALQCPSLTADVWVFSVVKPTLTAEVLKGIFS